MGDPACWCRLSTEMHGVWTSGHGGFFCPFSQNMSRIICTITYTGQRSFFHLLCSIPFVLSHQSLQIQIKVMCKNKMMFYLFLILLFSPYHIICLDCHCTLIQIRILPLSVIAVLFTARFYLFTAPS